MLGHAEQALWASYDLAMLDLDGVVYVGPRAVDGAVDHLAAARQHDMRLAFITNNASRPPEAVAAHLEELGVAADVSDVVTSAQAAARVLVDRLGPGARVLVLGGEGLRSALAERDLVAVDVDDEGDDPAGAVVTGYGPDVRWRDVMRAATRIRDGLWWVASNTDMTIPTPYGTAPGHGVLVETLQRFSGVDPVVAGKPARPLLDETVERVGGERPLMVGDRLDTDIAGGRGAGIDTLLVLTGVTGLAELVAAREGERPTYVSRDLGGLGSPHPAPEHDDDGWRVGGWRARVTDGELEVSEVPGPDGEDGSGSGGPVADDWWRVVASAAWDWLDQTGSPAGTARLEAPS